MSRLETSQSKMNSAWRISRQSSVGKHQLSGIQQPFVLPHKFMPVKGDNLNDSKFLNSSLEKIKLSSNVKSQEMLHTPRKSQQNGSFFVHMHNNNKQRQSSIQKDCKTPGKSSFLLKNRDSLLSFSEEQFGMLEKQAMKQLNSEYQSNKKLIIEIKQQFKAFKQSVFKELKDQKDMVLRMVEEITQNINLINSEKKKDNEQIQYSVQNQTVKQSIVKQFAKKQDEIIQKIQQFCEESDKKINIEENPYTPNSEPPQKKTENNLIIDIPQQPFFLNQLSSPITRHNRSGSKDSPDLAKCSQIVETINTLNELNDSLMHRSPITPISRSKQAERQAILDYKQKIQSVTRKNQDFNGNLSKVASPKSSYKLQKFYSAIDKLKEQINEIKQISDLKQTKSGRVIKNA